MAFTGVSGQPGEPVIPPATGMLLGIVEPGVRVLRQVVVGPVVAFFPGGWVDHPGDMPRGAENEAFAAAEQPGAGISALPGHDVVVMGGEDVGRRIDRAQVQLHPAAVQFAGFQVVLQIGVAQVPAVHRPRQVGAVVVPEQQVQRVWFLALEVLVDVVVPPQIVGAQQ
ncbi:hypothetical protein D3C78_1462000 [compost metagenome]